MRSAATYNFAHYKQLAALFLLGCCGYLYLDSQIMSKFFFCNSTRLNHIRQHADVLVFRSIETRNESSDSNDDSKSEGSGDWRDCSLPKLDPWHPSLLKYLKPATAPFASCVPKLEKLRSTLAANGTLSFRALPNETCEFRCNNPNGDHKAILGAWTSVPANKSVQPGCDVFDARCRINASVTHEFLYQQVVEQP